MTASSLLGMFHERKLISDVMLQLSTLAFLHLDTLTPRQDLLGVQTGHVEYVVSHFHLERKGKVPD